MNTMLNQEPEITNVAQQIIDAKREVEKNFADIEADERRESLKTLAEAGAFKVANESSVTLPSALGLLGKQAWSLKCLTEDLRSLSKVLYGDQRANATLALRHLEDAHHRLILAQSVTDKC